MLDDFAEVLRTLDYHRPAVAMTSTVTGEPVDPDDIASPGHWARQVTEPVRFADAVAGLIARNTHGFLEIGPHPVLAPAIGQAVDEAGSTAFVARLAGRGDDQPVRLLAGLAEAFVRGPSHRRDRPLPPAPARAARGSAPVRGPTPWPDRPPLVPSGPAPA